MEEFRFNSSDLEQSSGLNSPKFVLRLGIIQIVLFFISAPYYLYFNKTEIGVIWLVFSLLYFLILLYHYKRTNRLHIIVNNEFVDIYLSRSNNLKVDWNSISEIHFSSITLHIKLIDESSEHIDFGELPYKNIISIKENITRFIEAKSNNIK